MDGRICSWQVLSEKNFDCGCGVGYFKGYGARCPYNVRDIKIVEDMCGKYILSVQSDFCPKENTRCMEFCINTEVKDGFIKNYAENTIPCGNRAKGIVRELKKTHSTSEFIFN